MENGVELQPWVVLFEGESDSQVALWRIEGQNAEAIAAFSSAELADSYAGKLGAGHSVQRCDETTLLKILMGAHRSEIEFVALNPSESKAAKIFKVRDVLLAARERMKS
ncbi:MAG: hypothetical protein AB8B50_12550 [Pirellulaceae bacterium]